jgi:glyoxylase-like metal-dependent hydrolase (beta-lactamase superfamily II)
MSKHLADIPLSLLQVWGPVLSDIFARNRYDKEHELDAAIRAVGHDIKDIKHVVMGHLHLDHAGGLVNWIGTQVPIWVHKTELESAFYSCATGADSGVYLAHYMSELQDSRLCFQCII